MGARVIKIEQPRKGDDTRAWGPPFIGNESAYFLSVNRNKESLTLDLKAPAARPVLARLLDKADVIVENFRPGAMARLRLDYASVAASHPSIVYCSISGFGQTGPRRDEPGYDAVIQAEGGLMSITGEADGPPFRLGVAISDVVSGMFAFQGIAMALFARTTTGRGQHDLMLRQRAVHRRRMPSVEVNGMRVRSLVEEVHPEAIAFGCPDCRSGHLTVVRP